MYVCSLEEFAPAQIYSAMETFMNHWEVTFISSQGKELQPDIPPRSALAEIER